MLNTLLTISIQVAFFPPSSVVAVMVAFPTASAVTLPSSSTVATSSLSDVQKTFLLAAFEGLTVGSSPILCVKFLWSWQ